MSLPDPHPLFLAPQPWCDLYDPDDVDIPEHRELDLDRWPWWHRAFLESPVRGNTKRQHAQDGNDWGGGAPPNERKLRDIIALYYGMISAIDHQVGRIIDALEAKVQLDNTILIFISDHGLLLKGSMLYAGLLRVPMVACVPGISDSKFL